MASAGMSAAPERLGVVGAGTMGSGIAQLGCLAGMECLLHDPVPEVLDRPPLVRDAAPSS